MMTDAGDATATREGLVRALLRGLNRTAVHATTLGQAIAAQLGIAATDLQCLTLLNQSGSASAGHLADELGLTTGAITGVVDRLEAAGFVTRESDPADRRRVIVRPVGQRILDLERAYEPLLEAATHAFESYPDADLRLLLDLECRAAQLFQDHTVHLKAEATFAGHAAPLGAPLGSIDAATLEFATGAAELRIMALQSPGELYQATFEGPQPVVRVQGGTVTFRYRRMGVFELSKHSGVVALNTEIPWTIVVRGGAARVAIVALELQLRYVVILGAASQVEGATLWP